MKKPDTPKIIYGEAICPYKDIYGNCAHRFAYNSHQYKKKKPLCRFQTIEKCMLYKDWFKKTESYIKM